MDPAALLLEARSRAALTQSELAARSGTDASVLSSYERGRRTPSLATLERLLAAAGWQLRAELEPLHADLDRAVDELSALDLEERLARAAPWGRWVPETLAALVGADVPFAVTGPVAALLLGVPVPVGEVHLQVQSGVEPARRLVAGFRASRAFLLQRTGRDEWGNGVGALYVLPEAVAETGTSRWERALGERYVVSAVPQDPRARALTLTVAGAPVPVLPPGASTGDRALDRALERWRARQAASASPPTAAPAQSECDRM